MRTTTVLIEVPEQMVPYVSRDDNSDFIKRDAMMLYPFIRDLTISHGRAAEILGITKTDLVEIYDSLGIPYLSQDADDLAEDLATLDMVIGGVA